MSTPPAVLSRCLNVARAMPQIVLFGDSITQQSFNPELHGWGTIVCNYYARRADVLNRGYSGYTTRWAVPALPHIFHSEGQRRNVKLVTVFFGANDSCIKAYNPRHHVPLHTYYNNVASTVQWLKDNVGGGGTGGGGGDDDDDLRIVLITPPPFHKDSFLVYQKNRYQDLATGISERRNAVTKLYVDVVVSLGEKFDVPVLNLWERMMTERPGRWETFLSDGLHFSRDGNEFVGEQLLGLIETSFPELKVTPSLLGGYSNSGSASEMGHSLDWHDQVTDTSFEFIDDDDRKKKKRKER
jgi:isoamyl acetate esterase